MVRIDIRVVMEVMVTVMAMVIAAKERRKWRKGKRGEEGIKAGQGKPDKGAPKR